MICRSHGIRIHPASPGDIPAIEQIENSVPSPWSESMITAELNHSSGIQLVASKDKRAKIIGWCCARIVVPEAELLKITVAPHYRRSGAGTLLLHHLIDRCDLAGCGEMYLEVREKNHAAFRLYQNSGFKKMGIRFNYYSAPADSALILRKTW